MATDARGSRRSAGWGPWAPPRTARRSDARPTCPADGHLDGATLLARLPDVERHRAGTTLLAWAVTDSVLEEAVSTVDRGARRGTRGP